MTRPWVVVGLSQGVGLTDIRPLSNAPWVVQTEADVEQFRAFLLDPDRRLPVVVLTQPDRRRHTFPVSDFLLNGPELAKKLLGVAHVVQLTWDMAYRWTHSVGKLWSVFLGAVRTYMPGFDPDRDSPSAHPLETVEKIVFWKNPDDPAIGEGPFTQFLSDKLGQFAASRGMNWGTLAFAAEARTTQAEVARLEAKDGADWRQLYEDEIAGLKVEVSELKGEVQEYCQLADQADKERDQYKDANRQLRFQVDHLRQLLSERTGGKSESDIPIPDSYEEAADWVNRHLVGRLELHSRAHRGLKNADYEDVALVFRCLLLLANEYRNQCLGRDGAKDAFEKGLGENGLRVARSISPERAGEQGDEYYVRYPTAASPKRFLEWHLRKGSNKDTRYCLGIYYFWDDDTEQVVVGWLPSHLDNRMT